MQSPQEVSERQGVEIKEGGGPVGEGLEPSGGDFEFYPQQEQDPVRVSKISSGPPVERG